MLPVYLDLQPSSDNIHKIKSSTSYHALQSTYDPKVTFTKLMEQASKLVNIVTVMSMTSYQATLFS